MKKQKLSNFYIHSRLVYDNKLPKTTTAEPTIGKEVAGKIQDIGEQIGDNIDSAVNTINNLKNNANKAADSAVKAGKRLWSFIKGIPEDTKQGWVDIYNGAATTLDQEMQDAIGQLDYALHDIAGIANDNIIKPVGTAIKVGAKKATESYYAVTDTVRGVASNIEKFREEGRKQRLNSPKTNRTGGIIGEANASTLSGDIIPVSNAESVKESFDTIIINQGDTLGKRIKKLGFIPNKDNFQAIVNLNDNLSDANQIQVGQIIKIPNDLKKN